MTHTLHTEYLLRDPLTGRTPIECWTRTDRGYRRRPGPGGQEYGQAATGQLGQVRGLQEWAITKSEVDICLKNLSMVMYDQCGNCKYMFAP